MYDRRDNKTIYRFDFIEETTSIYTYDAEVKAITRFIDFLFSNKIYNLENHFIPNYLNYKDNLHNERMFNEEIDNTMLTINNTRPIFKDIVYRPFQRNYLFKNCYIYPKNKTNDMEICVENNKDLEYIETDERRKEGLDSLINIIENL